MATGLSKQATGRLPSQSQPNESATAEKQQDKQQEEQREEYWVCVAC